MRHDSFLEKRGFERIGHIFRLDLEVWWHPGHKIEIHVVDLDFCSLLRGIKIYYLRGLSEEGELYVRDLEAFHEYLQTHFPQILVSLNCFRDVSRSLAFSRIRQKDIKGLGGNFALQEAEDRLSGA